MPVHEKTTGGEVLLRGIDERVSAGDRVDVDDDFAAYLESRGDFRPVDVQDADFREVDDDTDESDSTGENDDETDETDSTDESNADGSDLIAVDEWLDNPYQERADRVLEGDVDAHLDTIAEEETSTTVQDAIGERRAELEG
ncbi:MULTISPECIES: hypothetical protein [Haloferacaceae]|uniref:Uncharacterized protein n=1 Tax=Halorubrum glutamatedens TaxID=2707018 RepID=A0ABD5QTA6_9EURY|nr:hypothetical protein [Halobellus captivus]